MREETVVLGLSGGVDYAVAARLLLEQGFRVVGLYLDIGLGGSGLADARAVADRLSIPLEVADIREALEERVCAPFARDYLEGRTPLPCARCNRQVKFPALLALAERLGGGRAATGHYARVREGRLYRGMPANDQSYMLARLTRAQLQQVLFPLGDYEKTQVRALAREMGLPVADKPDSMEICFIPDGDYAAWLDRRGDTPPPGDFVDEAGRVLGRHKGIHHYTLGQRRGLGIPAASRLFVAGLRPEENQVVLSADNGTLMADQVDCRAVNWLIDPPAGPLEAQVRLRHSKVSLPAQVLPEADGRARLLLREPGRAPTPGQLAVFYQDELVLGSAWIEAARPARAGEEEGQG